MTNNRLDSVAPLRAFPALARALLTALCFALAMLSNVAAAAPFSQLWVFGGPLEDMGNYASVFGDLPEPFYQNRFSNGPLAIETLAAQLGFTMTPSLHRVGPAQGNNFSSADGLASGTEPQDLHGQIDAYFAMTGDRADSRALYYLIIGGNEVIRATFETDDAAARALIKAAVDAKERAIKRLADKGAKTFLVANFVEIGFAPLIREAGLSARGDQMAQLHNAMMERMLDSLERRRNNIQLIRHDWAGWVKDVVKSADRLRFTNTTESCLAKLPLGQCDFDHFIFFNETFPSGRVHQLWGYTLVDEVVRSRDRLPRHHHD